jgi:hypothetical protein
MATAHMTEDLFQVICSRMEGERLGLFADQFIRPVPRPRSVDNLARCSNDEMRAQMTSVERNCAEDEQLVFHFTSIWSLGLVFKGLGLRASATGQLDGGLLVSLLSPADLEWVTHAGDHFRRAVELSSKTLHRRLQS